MRRKHDEHLLLGPYVNPVMGNVLKELWLISESISLRFERMLWKRMGYAPDDIFSDYYGTDIMSRVGLDEKSMTDDKFIGWFRDWHERDFDVGLASRMARSFVDNVKVHKRSVTEHAALEKRLDEKKIYGPAEI